LKCKQVNLLLEDYINHNLPEEQMHNIKQHLGQCEQCQKEYQFLKKYQQTLKKVEVRKAPQNFLANVHAKIDETQARKNFWQFFNLRRMEFVGAVVVGVVILLFVFPFQTHQVIQNTTVPEKTLETTKKHTQSAKLKKEILRPVKRSMHQKKLIAVKSDTYKIVLVVKRKVGPQEAFKSAKPQLPSKSSGTHVFYKSKAKVAKPLSMSSSVKEEESKDVEILDKVIPVEQNRKQMTQMQNFSNLISSLSGQTLAVLKTATNTIMNIRLPMSNYQTFISNLKKTGTIQEIKINKDTIKIINKE